MKSSAILLLLVAGCCRPATVAVVRTAGPRPALSIPAPEVIASFPPPAVAQPQRNVFAFRSVAAQSRPALRSVVEPHSAPQTVTPTPIIVDPPRKIEPSARYLGAFGPQTTPILVFKDGENVVNVALRKP